MCFSSRVAIVITHIKGLTTPLKTTHEPPRRDVGFGVHGIRASGLGFRAQGLGAQGPSDFGTLLGSRTPHKNRPSNGQTSVF